MQMAESQKGASSSVDPKEKASLLDEDIGKEFLSSWKSMSVADDDTMDFNFETVTKGKKKAFNFEKLDMDFALDGEFDKISSFKVDMPDLDFSCPPKKSGKPRERSGEDPASANHQAKQDHFTFAFDFNDFNFDSSLMKGEKKSNNCEDSKGGASDKSECRGSRIHLDEKIAYDDSTTMELPPSEIGTTSKVETLVGGLGNLDSRNDNCPSKSATYVNLGVSHGAKTSPEKTVTTGAEETGQRSYPSEETISTKPHAQQDIQDLAVHSVSGNDSIRDTVSELRTKVCVLATKLNTNSGGEQNIDAKAENSLGSNHENSLSKNSPSSPIAGAQSSSSESQRLGCDNHVPLGCTDGPEPAQSDLDFHDTSIASVSRNTPHDTKANQENHNSTSKLLLSPLSSGPIVDKLTPMKTIETGVIRSRFFKRSEETESQLHQASPACVNIISGGSKRIGMTHLSPADKRREDFNANDTQIGNKVEVRSHTRELRKDGPALMGYEKHVTDLNSSGENFNVDNAQNRSKLVGNSGLCDKEVMKGEPILLGSENKVKDLKIFSFEVNRSGSTEQITKSSTQKCVNPKLMVSSMASVWSSNISSAEGIKISSLKAARRTPGLSSLKITRTVGVNNDPSNSTFQKPTRSLQNSERDREVQGNMAFRTINSVHPEKQTSPTPLKRKTFEETNEDLLVLNPPKRLSESPKESRTFEEASERLVDEQVCNHANMVDGTTKNVDSTTKNFDSDSPMSTHDIPLGVDMTQLEIPLVMENDGNVEKAEACTKELEDICNMLKKKHEEAKELLVRAIVNNNNLLMLNHPIYEEKICMVQKFAAQLMSKELQT